MNAADSNLSTSSTIIKGTAMPSIKPAIHLIMREIDVVLSQVEQDVVDKLIAALRKGGRVVTIGAGRVGLATKGFAMRVGHLGLSAYALGDATVPSLGGETIWS